MKYLEKIRLKLRALKYKIKDDKGGIAYINSTIKKGQIAFDIGAHKAGYLYTMMKLVENTGKIFAFEPQSNLFRYIKKLKEQLMWENVTIEHLALSDCTSTAILYIPTNKVSRGSSPGASIAEHKDNTKFGKTENVSTETIDSYCNRNNI